MYQLFGAPMAKQTGNGYCKIRTKQLLNVMKTMDK